MQTISMLQQEVGAGRMGGMETELGSASALQAPGSQGQPSLALADGAIARRLLSLHAFLMVAVNILLLSQTAPVLADGAHGVLYETNFVSNNVCVYTIQTDGTLQQENCLPTGGRPRRIIVSPDKKLAYVMNTQPFEITSYEIGPRGNLTKRPTSGPGISFALFPDPTGAMALSPNRHKLYVPWYITYEGSCIPGPCPPPDSGLDIWVVDDDGYILGREATLPSGAIPRSVAVTPRGDHLYVATEGASRVCIYNLDEATGSETDIPGCVSVRGEYYPEFLTVDRSGQHLYVLYNGPQNNGPASIAAFSIDTPSGLLSLVGTAPAGQYAFDMTFDRSGKYAAVLDHDGDALCIYHIAPNGMPSLNGCKPTGHHPFSVAFSPDNRHLYVVGISDNSLVTYAFDEITGQVAWQETTATGSGPTSIAVVGFEGTQKDFDGDGKTDILWRNTSTGDVAGWLMDGVTIASGAIITSGLPLEWVVAGTGDLNGDGKTDILWRNTSTGDVAGWLMDGVTIASGAIITSGLPLEWVVAGTGDLNGDGKTDILWRNTSTGDVAGWLMDGVTIASGAIIASGLPLEWVIANH